MIEPKPGPTPNEDARERTEAHNLARQGLTKCMSCGEVFPTEKMTVLRVEFRPAVKRDKVRSRTVGKLCPECREEHPLWNLPTSYV